MKKLVVFAGPNGSGKSTIVDNYLEACPMPYICPDNYAKQYDYIASEKERYLIAMQEAEKDRYTAVYEGYSFAFETVFSSDDKFDFIDHAKTSDYTVEVFFITTSDPQINIDRVAKRVEDGGHDVPREKILERYSKSMGNLAKIIQQADIVNVYDFSADEGTPLFVFIKNQDEHCLLNKEIRPDWCDEFIRHPLEFIGYFNNRQLQDLTIEETDLYFDP